MPDRLPLPPAPITYYPRPCFPPVQRRPHAALGDPLLARLKARLTLPAPPTRPCLRRRPQATTPAKAPSLRAATRTWNDVLGIWRRCAADDCRARRRCCGDPLGCMPRYLPLLPAPARRWFAAIGLALERGVSFTDALAAAEREGEQAACERWQAAVAGVLAEAAQDARPSKRSGE